MRCKPGVVGPTGCRAASCRFLPFSVVFLPFRPAFPAFSADRSSCLLRHPLLLSFPPSAPPVFPAVPSSPFPALPPAPALFILLCVLPGKAPFRPPFRSVFCPSLHPPPLPLRRLFPLAPLLTRRLFPSAVPPTPCPCPFSVPFPPPRYIFFCYRTNGIRNISVNLSRKNPQSNRFQLKYLKINSYDFD